MPVSFPSPRVLDMSGKGRTDGWVDEGAQARPPAAPGPLISVLSELFGADTTLDTSDGEWSVFSRDVDMDAACKC